MGRLEQAIQTAQRTGKTIYIRGASWNGRRLGFYLDARRIPFAGYLDGDPQKQGGVVFGNHPCFAPGRAAPDGFVLIAVEKESLQREIAAELEAQGIPYADRLCGELGACIRALDERAYLETLFPLRTGYPLDLDNPRTFNEKLQWLKLYDRRPEHTVIADKYAAKQYVADRIGGEHIVPTLGVWDSPEEIDYDALPAQFVLKCTHDSSSVTLCEDKASFDREKTGAFLAERLRTNQYWVTKEWCYKNIRPRIIAEPYLSDGNRERGLTDYKFFCFHGAVKYLYISVGLEDHSTASISFLTPEWEFAPFQRRDYRHYETLPPKPSRYRQMCEIAEKLSAGYPFLRVDLYEIAGKVYFSELTLFPCSGYIPFAPPEWDGILGGLIRLPEKREG